MAIIIFIILLPFNALAKDYLYDAMFTDWTKEEVEEPEYDDRDDSWELGVPDNTVYPEIIYEQARCYCD